MEAWEGATAADRTVAQVWRRTLIEDAGYSAAEVSQDDADALDLSAPYECGFWTATSERSVRECLDEICRGIAGYYSSPAKVWRLQRVAVEPGAPALTFRRFSGDEDEDGALDEVHYNSLELVASNDRGRGVPACRVTVEYAPNDAVQGPQDLGGDPKSTTDPVGGPTVREFLKKQYLAVSYPAAGRDPAVLRAYGEEAAVELTFTTALRSPADAAALVSDLFAYFSVLRDRFRMKADLTLETADVATVGVDVGLQAPRYGLDAGKAARAYGIEWEGATVMFDLGGVAA